MIDGILDISPVMAVIKSLINEEIPTKVSLTMEYLGGVQHRFEKDKADLMLVKEYQANNQLVAKPLDPIECLLCVSAQHPLADLATVDLSQLQQTIELSVHDSSGQDLYSVQHMHFGGERMFYLSDFKSKKQALLEAIGFGWMPYYLVQKELKSGLLKEVKYRHGSRFSFTPHLVWHADKPLGKTGQRFVEMLLKVASN